MIEKKEFVFSFYRAKSSPAVSLCCHHNTHQEEDDGNCPVGSHLIEIELVNAFLGKFSFSILFVF